MTYQDTQQLLSDAKFYEAYARFNDKEGRYETWEEAVDRVMSMHRTYYKGKKIGAELEKATRAYKDKLANGAQRALQFGGDQILKHQLKMYNCLSSYADRPDFFGEFFYALLCGCGVGASVQKHHVAKLPKIIQRTKAPKAHVVDDSIEGWAEAVDVLLSSYFENGGKHSEYRGHRIYFDLTQIRPKGSMISGGFKAPGPDGLRLSLDRIEHILQGIVLDQKKASLRPIQVYDILMHISDAVLSGGVRRSACIILFSPDDEEMMNAKTGNWFAENRQRARSNNSVVLVRDEMTKEELDRIITRIKEFGEPGFLFVNSREHCTNPCVEIGMFPQLDGVSGFQACNLTEINGGMCTTPEKFFEACEAAAILGTLQAGYTDLKFMSQTSRKIFEREALLGVSVTGWMMNPQVLFDEDVLQKGAKIVLETNKRVAKLIGINPAARATCVKPSGTSSILLMTPAGIHPDHAPVYIRNVQMNKDTEVAQLIKETNPYMVEESVWSSGKTDYMVSFPIITKEGSKYKDEIYGIRHLDIIKKVQQNWVEYGTDLDLCVDKTVRHNVSNTVVIEEWDGIAEYLFENRYVFSGVAFIGSTGDRAYNQAPNTKIKSMYEMVSEHGMGVIFASGLIVDALKVFDTLWAACTAVPYYLDAADFSAMESDWCRRYVKFAENYFDGDLSKVDLCLKDVYLRHKWEKIQQNLKPIDWSSLTQKRFIDVDTLAAAACMGVTENGEAACFV
jgi:ribonucleoside-triphosphate reductase